MNIAVDHLTNLARLSLNKEEKKRLETDLAGIFAYIDQLREVDTEDVAEITHAAPQINQLREDALPSRQAGKLGARNEEEVVALRDAFPMREEAYTRVPLVINKN